LTENKYYLNPDLLWLKWRCFWAIPDAEEYSGNMNSRMKLGPISHGPLSPTAYALVEIWENFIGVRNMVKTST
jgi:hypothetical protein